uniref:L(1)G0196_0 protein n=1 Tax=Fopius arisanus TaxID=64838 RepID=A0A0C9QB84_9HYME
MFWYLVFTIFFFFSFFSPFPPTTTSKNPRTRHEKSEDPRLKKSARSRRNSPTLTESRNILGIPMILPYTLSSPEFPAPLLDSLQEHGPLVTFHNTSLGSPTTKRPSIQISDDAKPFMSTHQRYGRSKSTLTLPVIEVPGEFGPVRSKSLSPSPRVNCQCYNCNISELILQSHELSPSERSNLRTYFARSMSRKFINCSCYGVYVDGPVLSNQREDLIPSEINSRRQSLDRNSLVVKNCLLNFDKYLRHRLIKRHSWPLIVRTEADTRHASLPPESSSCTSDCSPSAQDCHYVNYHSSYACKHDERDRKTQLSTTLSKIHAQRSFSSPDTRPTIIQPDPTCTARRHRHSISGQMSYFKLLGINVTKKLTGSANSLFSTAVISGSSSAPNLKDMVPPHASAVAAIEGFGGVPPIRPLETLHNALSLRQLDCFLEMMTSAPLFRTPASSPPKFPSPGGSQGSLVPHLSIGGAIEPSRFIAPSGLPYKPGEGGEVGDHRAQLSPTSPNSTGWSSEPQSFLSSEPSSPAPTSAGECSMSISLISNDGSQPFAGPKFSAGPCLEMDFNEFCMVMDQEIREGRGSISYTDYYSSEDGTIRKTVEEPKESMEDEEEHTLTLRQSEEQKKQDVQSIFEQKPSGFKKIGRFRVESMEIADEDVRIKTVLSASQSLEKLRGQNISPLKKDRIDDGKKSRSLRVKKGKTILRSQSVSGAQGDEKESSGVYEGSLSTTKLGSFSTMSGGDLENWKKSVEERPAKPPPTTDIADEPTLTLAGSMKDSSNVTIGFDIKGDKQC